MAPQKGYYSLIQFCPDASRQETVNLGVLLFCPASGFLDAKTSSNTRRAEKLVGRRQLARKALKQAQLSIEQRLKVGRASVDYHYRLPVLEQDFKVPFAYRNGTLNLVKPQRFLDRAPQKVLELATRGNLIRKHGLPDEPHSRLIVVSRFESTCEPEFISHVDRLLNEYDVTHVPEQKLDHFITLVDSEAHG